MRDRYEMYGSNLGNGRPDPEFSVKSRSKPVDHDPIRRNVLAAATFVGLQSITPSAFATSLPPPPYTFEELILTARLIVIAEIHRFLFSELRAANEFKPRNEIQSPYIAVLDITIKRILATSPKLNEAMPLKGSALVYFGGGVTERDFSFTPYPAAMGKDVILLLEGRSPTMSTDAHQTPIYRITTGNMPDDRVPLPLSRLEEVRAAAVKAGFTLPN